MLSISIIVPVYNADKTLRECVDSILCQDYRDFELLLIDDGSKDQSPAICNEYSIKDNRVKAYHQPNGGVSSARNFGIEHAQGEWITFIDADDYITQGFFDDICKRDEDIIIKGYQKFDIEGKKSNMPLTDSRNLLSLKEFLILYITDSLLRCPWAKFYKKSIIKDIRFLTDMKIGEDAWFVFKYLKRCRNYAIVSSGDYMVRLAEQPDEVKYAISVDYAVQSLRYLQDAFDGLVKTHHIDKSLFLHYIGYFKRISKGDWQTDKTKWYGNTDVKTLYDYVWPALPFNQKLRLTITRLLKK